MNVKPKNVISSLHLFIDLIGSININNIFSIAQYYMCSAYGGAINVWDPHMGKGW